MATEEDGGSVQVSSDIQPGDRGSFRCVLCGVNVPNRPSLDDHIRGRRHKRMCEERDKRQQQQERSVFVSGFPKGTTEEQIRDVFQPISPVKNIVIDKDRGLFAIVEFENSDGVSAALEQHDLKLEGQRLKIKPREKKEFKKKRTGVRSLQPPDQEALSKELIHCKDVAEQMKSVVTLCSPSRHESHLRELLLSLLKETFTEFFPGCQLHPFGSSVNGFEISGCDLDLYLELGDVLNGEKDNGEDVSSKEEDMDKGMKNEGNGETVDCLEVEEVKKDEIMEAEETKHDEDDDGDDDETLTPGLSLKGLSNEEILNVVERVLRQCVPGVHGVQSVPSARRPVIRFQHKTSGLRGDITLNNRLALRNSYYLRLCSDLDPRVPQLVYTVRYWARINQLAGNPLGGGPLMNNYALTLLIIFFLQSRSPVVIPSLSQLKEMAADEDTQDIEGWDCTFPSDPTQIQPSKNEQSLGCLLSEFFSFFASLDLRSSILCPRDGVILTLPFTSPPPSWADGFRLGTFNVQDPFELSHNVCSNVSSKTARHFSSQCISAAKTCRLPLYSVRSLSRPWGIILLLLHNTSEVKKKEGIEISIPLTGTSLKAVTLAVKRVLVEVLLCSCEEESSLKNEAENTGGGKDELERSGEDDEQAVSHMESSLKNEAENTGGGKDEMERSGEDDEQAVSHMESSLKNEAENTSGGKDELERSGDDGEQAVSHMESSLKNEADNISGGKDEMERSGDDGEQAVSHMEGLIISDEKSELKAEELNKDGVKTEPHGRKREIDIEDIQNDNKRRKVECTNEDLILEQESTVPGKKVCKKAKKLKELAKENVSLMRINVWHQVWEGRRKQRRNKFGEMTQKIEVETAVSHALSSGTLDKPCKPLIQITVKTKQTNEGNAQLHLTPEVDDYRCSADFLHFLKIFLPQMVQEIINGHG